MLFPVVLALVCAGWGLLFRDLLRLPLDGAAVVPFGFAVVVVATGMLTASAQTAPATVAVIAVGAVIGLARAAPVLSPDRWAVGVGVMTLLAFGAPVVLSGHATFAGYIRLDDTATWLGIVDRVTGHGRSLASLPPSTYALNLREYLDAMGYPIGAFLPLGVGRALVGVDAAWVFQPFLAFCGALVGMSVFSIGRGLVRRVWLRALVAFLAAQPALLYGYSQWGGIKELAAAALLLPLAILAGIASAGSEPRRGVVVALAITCAAVGVTLGPGALAWLAPVLVAVGASRVWRTRSAAEVRVLAVDAVLLGSLLAVLLLPVWLELSAFLRGAGPLFSSVGSSSGPRTTGESGLVSLVQPLSVFQLAGVWPVGDFRLTAPGVATAPLLAAVAIGIALAVYHAPVRRERSLTMYLVVTLVACLIVWLGGSNPWIVAKAMAIGSPALLTAGLLGAGALWTRSRALAGILLCVIGGGVLWSNALAYHDVVLAPQARLAELQQIAPLVAARPPTLINEYEIYADRHFLRDGAPTEPAEYRSDLIRLRDGELLTQSAQADLDAFPLQTLEGYRSIVTRASPVASRPPSIYSLRWHGRYYELWQRPAHPSRRILLHVPLGDASSLPFCGQSNTGYRPLCAIQPAAPAPCGLIRRVAASARAARAQLVAYQRPGPIVVRASQTLWPPPWRYDPAAQTLMPTSSGDLVAHIRVANDQLYGVWLGGSFARGFEVNVDGHALGRLKDQQSTIGQYVEVGARPLSAGVHLVRLRYPPADLTPGSGAEETLLSGIVLEPMQIPATEMLTVNPADANTLCGRELDWLEVVAGGRGGAS